MCLNWTLKCLFSGPIPYIVVQEMFDEKDQSAAFTISMAVNWITSFVVLFLFRILQVSYFMNKKMVTY